MATKNITFDPDSGVPYGLNLTIYGGSDFSTNLNSRGQVIASENSNGESDSFVTKSIARSFDSEKLDYREYTFTADQLPSFKTYRIKISLTSKSQCFVPRIKDLRVIALA